MIPKIDTSICRELCSKKICLVCWRIKYDDPCRKYKLKLQETIDARNRERYERSLDKLNKEKDDFENFTDDLVDSKGDDISEEEFVENEQFFALQE